MITNFELQTIQIDFFIVKVMWVTVVVITTVIFFCTRSHDLKKKGMQILCFLFLEPRKSISVLNMKNRKKHRKSNGCFHK